MLHVSVLQKQPLSDSRWRHQLSVRQLGKSSGSFLFGYFHFFTFYSGVIINYATTTGTTRDKNIRGLYMMLMAVYTVFDYDNGIKNWRRFHYRQLITTASNDDYRSNSCTYLSLTWTSFFYELLSLNHII